MPDEVASPPLRRCPQRGCRGGVRRSAHSASSAAAGVRSGAHRCRSRCGGAGARSTRCQGDQNAAESLPRGTARSIAAAPAGWLACSAPASVGLAVQPMSGGPAAAQVARRVNCVTGAATPGIGIDANRAGTTKAFITKTLFRHGCVIPVLITVALQLCQVWQ